MPTLYIWFWTATVFLAIAWYAIMLLYVGVKGGRELVQMTRDLSKKAGDEQAGRVAGPDDGANTPTEN